MYVNFDDNEIIDCISDQNKFIESLHQIYGETKMVFFDEIQNLPNWELFLNKLEREGYNIFVTGSNSDLLNTKFASSLTGRYVSFDLFPFNFSEFLVSQQEGFDLLEAVDLFLKNGGFPEIVVNKVEALSYVSDLFYSIVYKDIIKRYNLRNYQSMDSLVSYLIANFCQILNFTTISKVTDIKSTKTLKKYLGYLENSYICSYLSCFNFKSKNILTSKQKVYFYDNSFLMYKNMFNSFNKGYFFENLVFTELVKKGLKPSYDLFYYRTKNNYEVDFVIKQGIRVTTLVQVCYDILSIKTEEREIRSLVKASEELGCYNLFIVTKNVSKEEKVGGKVIKFIPFDVFCEEGTRL